LLADDRRRLHYDAAIFASSQIFGTIELFEDTLELIDDVCQLKILFVELVIAVLTKPEQAIELAVVAFAFDDKADSVRSAKRIMRNSRRKKEDLALADRYLDGLTVFLDLHFDIALKLVEKLFALVPVVILTRIRPADYHHDKIVISVNALIPDRRL